MAASNSFKMKRKVKEMKFPIAIQVYSVRDFAKQDLYGTLKQLKEMGYDGVEFAGLYDHTPAEVRAMCEELGLVPVSAHVPFKDMLGDPDGVIGMYKEIGCKYIAIPSMPGEIRAGTDGFGLGVEKIAELGREVERIGDITLLYHNHDTEFLSVNGKYCLDVIYDTVPANLLQTELDTCWVNVGGENPAEYLLKYAGRSPVLHLKDFVGEKSENMYELIGEDTKKPTRPSNFALCPVGYGKQDFPSIIASAEKAGVQWLVVEQDNPTEQNNSLECAKLSRDYLRSIGY